MPQAGRAEAPSKTKSSVKPASKRTKAPEGKPVRPARTTRRTPERKLKVEEIKQGKIGIEHNTL